MSNVRVTINVYGNPKKEPADAEVRGTNNEEAELPVNKKLLSNGGGYKEEEPAPKMVAAVQGAGGKSPSLAPYFGSLKVKTKYRVQVKSAFGIYITIGSGAFTVLSSTEIAFSGKVASVNIPDLVGYRDWNTKNTLDADFQLKVVVTGNNTGTYSFNGLRGSCEFKVNGEYLTIMFKDWTGHKTFLEFQWWHDGLWIGGMATPKALWIGP